MENGLAKIRKIVRLTYLSAYLKNSRPLSLMIIAPPEQGKTHYLKSFKSTCSRLITDLSFSGLIGVLREDEGLKHLIVPDFLKLTEKKKSTKDNLLSFLNSFLEEGIEEIKLGNTEKIDLGGRNGGLITATTKGSYQQNKKNWESVGFMSRFLTISYSYSDETKRQIMKNKKNEDKNEKPETVKPTKSNTKNPKPQTIEIPAEIEDELISFSNLSIRKFENFKTLIRCIALDDYRNKVEQKDLEELKELNEFMNTEFKEI